ncbi:enoyl-CoA hydratase/isomerase family protein [Rhodospirillaceae bacterium KN72]|uniref:Enoyl-CoA hydratase/isomerase family protein n=1 Tax=Pacificispira spongiicola TaxID=2729598 RepID=A0A7Y0E3N4_9PROT|nr:enoyl-CoA hydratase/isomerase family protein [Pacificispira spongiicola]NMM46645.1 enoyl-CoA hydratase/isomerase family protein [Pacificispira spongiicola]
MAKLELVKDGAVARVRLTNPDLHNAFDDGLIADLTQAFGNAGGDDAIRVVVLEAEGKSFSAGADLNWMKRVATYGLDENIEDARGLAGMLKTINFLPKPVIGRVQGAAFGGGVGLVACCDIAIGTPRASFSLSEVKLGLIPSAISPYVVAAIGQRAARRYFTTGERFDAATAHKLGLLHDVVEEAVLDDTVEGLINTILGVGPKAAAAAKDLVFAVDRPLTDDIVEDTAQRIARLRATPEAQEGLGAFLEKRRAFWNKSV